MSPCPGFGVEEEYLLLDPSSGAPVPAAAAVLARTLQQRAVLAGGGLPALLGLLPQWAVA